MTTNQLIAMGFPLLAAAAVGLTGVFVRKPWAEEPDTTVAVQERRSDTFRTPREAIVAAKTLLDQALRELPPEPPMPGAPRRPSR